MNSNYPPGVYDCGKCGQVVASFHACEERHETEYEVHYSKDGGLVWYLLEEVKDKDRALEIADELIEDGFESMVVDDGNNIIFRSTDKKEVA